MYWKGWDTPGVPGQWEGWEEWNDESLKGRGLVDFDIFPHFVEGIHEELVEQKLVDYPHSVKILSDTKAAVQACKDGVVRSFDFYADGSMGEFKMSKVGKL